MHRFPGAHVLKILGHSQKWLTVIYLTHTTKNLVKNYYFMKKDRISGLNMIN